MRRIALAGLLAAFMAVTAITAVAASPNSEVSTYPTKAGTVITDAAGRTLYLYESDKGTTSECYSACAEVWPPFTATKKPVGVKGASSSLIGLTKRTSGPEQVTYDGHPLYYYAGDPKAGEITGNGLHDAYGLWYALKSTGAKA